MQQRLVIARQRLGLGKQPVWGEGGVTLRRPPERNADKAERRAWLAQVAAQEVRRMVAEGESCPPP